LDVVAQGRRLINYRAPRDGAKIPQAAAATPIHFAAQSFDDFKPIGNTL
jgi:hypothetical protein